MECTPVSGGMRQDRVRELLIKQVESEARIEFWGEIVRLKVGTRELEKIGESLHCKFRSKSMQSGNGQRVLIENGGVLKLRDEKKYRRELYCENEMEKSLWRKELKNVWKYKRKMNLIKDIARKHKKKERKRLNKKLKHLITLKKEMDEKDLKICPIELDSYKDAIVYDKDKFDRLCKDEIKVNSIGDVDLSKEEMEVLRLHPKFGVMERLDSTEMEIEIEMGAAKYRYNILKEDEVMEDDVYNENNDENE